MSLDWDISKCKNSEEILLNQEIEGDKTNQIIWASLVIKLGDITEENWTEWYARNRLWSLALGYEDNLEPLDFHRRIGMSTNVWPAETRSKWLNSVIKRELERNVQHAKWMLEQSLEEENVDA